MVARRPYLPPEEPKEQPSESDLAWAAGFMEGEAAFMVKAGRDLQSRVTVVQKDREPLEMLLRWFGGRIYYDRRRDYYIWAVRSHQGRACMTTIRPYVRSRRRQDQIDLALTVARATAMKGTAEYIEQRRRARLGKRNSPEMNKKISEAITRWHAERKASA